MTLKKFYISFGQAHAHSVGGRTFDKDCIAVMEAYDRNEAHEKAMEIFKGKFAFLYTTIPKMEYFPRGLMTL